MHRLFEPCAIGPVVLRNRSIRAAAFEGMCPGHAPSPELLAYHRALAEGGVGMTTVAYAAVERSGLSFPHQLWIRPEVVPGLRALTDAVHAAGARASIQLGHCGNMARRALAGGRPLAPSARFNLYGPTWPRAMDQADIDRVVASFGQAVRLAADAGFDAVEIHAGHGYLLSQFLSPATNHRRDAYGGSLAGRARFMREAVAAAQRAARGELAVLVKVTMRDGFPGGMELDEGIAAADLLARDGVDALVLSSGFVSRAPLYMLRGEVPVRQMIAAQERTVAKVGLFLFGRLLVQRYPYEETFFLPEARQLRAAVRLPLVLLGGIKTRHGLERAMREGFELAGMGRALLHDATLPRRLAAREVEASGCVPCNECIAEMDRGGVRCTRAAVTTETR